MNNRKAELTGLLCNMADIKDAAIKQRTKELREENRMKTNAEIDKLVSQAVTDIMKIYDMASAPIQEQIRSLSDFE